MENVFLVPKHNIGGLFKRVETLNKKAAKNGLDPVEIELTGEHEIRKIEGKSYIYLEVKITGEAPIIKGWSLVAAIEYMDVGEVVAPIDPTFDCPAHYRGAKPFCEHCNTHKVKRYSYLLRNVETGEVKNVGKTCMKDYLGDDIAGEVARFDRVLGLINELRDEDSDWYGCGGGEPVFSVGEILSIGAVLVREYGYVPSGDEYSTKNAVMCSLTATDSRDRIVPNPEDEVFAEKAIEWIEGETGDNDFILNCKNIVKTGYVNFNKIGYVVGILGGYVKHLDRESKKFEVKNEYFGEVKKRYTLDLTLIKLTSFEGYYGTTYVHTFRDNENRIFVWFGSKRLTRTLESGKVKVETGESLTVKATVKSHDEYRGTLQTNITRVAEFVKKVK